MNGLKNLGNTCYFNAALQCFLLFCDSSNEDPFQLFQEKFPRFTLDEQHDAHDALMCLIELFHDKDPRFIGKAKQETVYPNGKVITEVTLGSIVDYEEYGKWDPITDYVDTNGKVYNIACTRITIKRLPDICILTWSTRKARELPIIVGHELVAIIVHVGSQRGGHYVALVKKEKQWYLCDDENVKKVELSLKSNKIVAHSAIYIIVK